MGRWKSITMVILADIQLQHSIFQDFLKWDHDRIQDEEKPNFIKLLET